MRYKAELEFEVFKILIVLFTTLMFSSMFAAYYLMGENLSFAVYCTFAGLALFILFLWVLPKFAKSIDTLHNLLE